MGRSLDNQFGFSSGEYSPLLDSRVDLPGYAKACRQMQNMIALRHGGATRKPGTRFIAKAKYAFPNTVVRLMPFQFSPTTSFQLEFGQYYLRFFSNQQPVTLSSAPVWVTGTTYKPSSFVQDPTDSNHIYYYAGLTFVSVTAPHLDPNWTRQSIYELVTPWPADSADVNYGAEIALLKICQINDVVYITHPRYAPYKLVRLADTNWTLTEVNFLVPPLLDQNDTGIYIGASGTTGNVNLSANADAWVTAKYYSIGQSVNSGSLYTCIVEHTSGTFAADLANGFWRIESIFQNSNVNGYWQMVHVRNAASISIGLTANAISGVRTVSGDAEFITYGTWSATADLERSDDLGSTWYKVRSITAVSGDNNRSYPISVIGEAQFRINVTGYTASTGTPRAVFNIQKSLAYGIIKITSVANPYFATGTVISQLYSTDTTFLWNEGAWSARRGYPQALTAFQQRMIYGGSAYEPQRIWGSQQDDLENFKLGDQTLATDSFAFDLAAVSRGRIQWLIGQVDLLVGFAGAEWIVNAGGGQFGGSGEPVTPQAINAGEHSSWGSAPGISPALAGNFVLFTQRSAKTVQQMAFSVYTNKYQSNDLTGLSEHMFGTGVKEIAYQPQFRDESIIWVVMNGGSLCGMTYDAQSEVFAWHRHITGYDEDANTIQAFESVSVIEGQGQEDDEVWLVVNRPNGRCIELINPANWETSAPGIRGIAQPDIAQAIYVDAAITIHGPASNVLGGMTHLAGLEVIGLLNGNMTFGPLTVSVGGTVTLENYDPQPSDVIQIGLPVPYALQCMRPDVDPRQGFTQGITKALSRVYLRLFNSLAGKISGNGLKQIPIEYKTQITPLGYIGNLFTGQKEVVPESTQTDDPIMIIQGSEATPLTVLAVINRQGITGSR
jgi:hypothetical protein